MLVGQHPRDVREQPGAVEGLDLDGDEERGGAGGLPVDLQDALRLLLEVAGVGAVVAVDADAAGAGDEAEDGVAGDRGAAAGELDPDVVDAEDLDAGVEAAVRVREGRVGMAVSAMSSTALRSSGHFLRRDVVTGRSASILDSRDRLVDRLARAAGL